MNASIFNQSASLFSDLLHDPQESYLCDVSDMGDPDTNQESNSFDLFGLVGHNESAY